MGMVVRSNIMAVNANRQLGMNNSQVTKSLEKLASGFKINRAGDDASGLAISEKMKAQIKGLETASANSQDGISLIQTAEGALTEVHSMLNRMVELAGKSANGTIQDDVDRDNIQNEVNALISEIDRIGDSTNFNGINLIDGNLSATGGSSSTSGSGKINFKLSDAAMAGGAQKFSDAVKGKYVTGAFAAGEAVAANGSKFEMQIFYKDESGADQSTKITLTANSATELQAADGTKYNITGAGATDKELRDAFMAEAAKGSLGKVFDIAANGTTKIDFTAKTKGTAGASVTTIVQSDDTAAAGTQKVQASGMDTTNSVVATDKYDSLDISKFKAWDGAGDLEKADVFEVNGSKFLFVNSNLTNEQLAKLAPDVTAIKTGQTNGTVATGDRTAATAAISAKTGIAATDNLAANTLIDFKPKAGQGGTAGTGGLTLQVGDTADKFNQVTVSVDDMRSSGLGIKGLDVSTQESAKTAIATIKEGINKVSTNRGNLGALQNRLEYTINNLDVTAENMSAANSRVRDTDMAKQMMDYTKMNVLNQAAQAMLAQANQQPQSILQLLQ